MNTNTAAAIEIPAEFQTIFEAQQAAYRRQVNPSLAERQADVATLHRLLIENQEAIIEAINQDYGTRCRAETELTEILVTIGSAKAMIKDLKKLMKPVRRHLDFTQYPLAKAWTFPQPLGVVGVVVPWNFPVNLSFCPLIAAFAAGNRAMVKMSENSNHLALLLKQISPNYFPLDKLAFFEDGGGRGPAFTRLPFDFICFTGSPATAKAVMKNAANNLTPVLLELGGKSPCVVAPDYSIKEAASRILWAKMLNCGQICTNVDYLFLPENKVDTFIAEARRIFNERVPDINNGDYTAVIDQRAYDRLEATLADAVAKGARVVDLYTGPTPDVSRRLMPTRLVLGVTDDMEIMQREIFGPLLPIRTYASKEEVVDYVMSRPRPLAFYVYSNDHELQSYYLNNTISGGVGINESVIQAGLHDLPFGGVGNSGMGHYHGQEGFATFSKIRPVFKQGPVRSLDFVMPPYSGRSGKILKFLLRLNS